MLILFFLRHGQTHYNIQERVHGWNDAPLTELGICQARCAGYGARHILFSHAYSGDILRQIITANIFLSENDHPIDAIPDMHFREMGYGKFEDGTYYNMLKPLYDKYDAPYDGYDGLYRYYDAIQIGKAIGENDETGAFEGNEKATKRLLEGLDILTSRHKDGNILISTSSYAIALVINHLFPEIPQNALVGNASLTIIGYENGRYSMISFDDISYRKEGEDYFKSQKDAQ